MSILIKSIEMPTEDEMLFLRIYPNGKVTIDGDLECKQIATAVPVQPHGRLIDADELMQTIREHDYPLTAYPLNSTDNGMFTLGIQQAVDETPTVVEAEAEGDTKNETG